MSTDEICFIDSVVERTLGLRQLIVAESQDEAQAWSTHKLAFWIKQSECLGPIDETLRVEARNACSVWKKAEQIFLSAHSLRLTDVYQMLQHMHGLMSTRTDSQRIISDSPEWMQNLYRHLPVKNMGWVRSFMLLLPAADHDHASIYQGVAKTMVASFYTFYWRDRLYEYPETSKPNIDWAYEYAFDTYRADKK